MRRALVLKRLSCFALPKCNFFRFLNRLPLPIATNRKQLFFGFCFWCFALSVRRFFGCCLRFCKPQATITRRFFPIKTLLFRNSLRFLPNTPKTPQNNLCRNRPQDNGTEICLRKRKFYALQRLRRLKTHRRARLVFACI